MEPNSISCPGNGGTAASPTALRTVLAQRCLSITLRFGREGKPSTFLMETP